MQLQEGITADQAIRALDQLVVDLENLRAMGGVPVDIAPDRYLGWVADAERQLRNLFVDPDAAATLRTPLGMRWCGNSRLGRRARSS